MEVYDLRTNGLTDPLGYDFSYLTLSWKAHSEEGSFSKEVRIKIWKRGESAPCFDSGVLKDYHKCFYSPKLKLLPRERYFWQVWIKNDAQEEAVGGPAWFETAKMEEAWGGKWISPVTEGVRMPVLYKEFIAQRSVADARLYLFGAGLYEVYVNGERAGEEYLQPGYHSYDLRMEYQTYDLGSCLREGKNRIAVMLGEGWYKGRFGFDGDFRNLYGSRKKCIGELYLVYVDGVGERIVTDGTWKAAESAVLQNGIYDGEWVDDTLPSREIPLEEIEDDTSLLTARTNPPIRKTEQFEPVSVKLQEDCLLLDFGEAITGWVEIEGGLKRGQRLYLQYGEVLQNGRFYNDNLRTAKAEFCYISDGSEKIVRPHFTYYGFRYVKVKGAEKGQKLMFHAYRLMSAVKRTGNVVTSNKKVNRLFENTLRSQKCNFLDIPTDCPQRDERMGWTGDTAVFASTACFHMDCMAFFRHYAKSLYQEQLLANGEVPFFAPRPKIKAGEGINPFYYTGGVCGFGDVAAILPWTLYRYYGDRELLREQYPMMQGWVDYLTAQARENKTPYLWQNGRQLGDWLALDNGDLSNPIGKTDVHLLASAYYYYSVSLCGKAALALEDERAEEYSGLADRIRTAFLSYYFAENGELTVEPTQTACAFLLWLKLYTEKGKAYLICSLQRLLQENAGKLNTGFVGTQYLCPALSENGCNGYAYELLLNEEYPGWLFEVNMGATTVWERWNSLNGDGTVSGTGMNSLNHYAYGCISQWLYQYVCGFQPSMGEKVCMTISPRPDRRLGYAQGSFESVYGVFESAWYYREEGLVYHVRIPFNGTARLELPKGGVRILTCGDYWFDEEGKKKNGVEKTGCRNDVCHQL